MDLKRQIGCAAFLLFMTCVRPAAVLGIDPPVEPQSENPEFTLDVWTNRYDRYWREAWDGGDNRFRLRFGSNNVREWNLEEDLKLAADLVNDRLRFRFYHTRLFYDSADQRGRDTFELELCLSGAYYASFFASPTFAKAENSLGLMLQYRSRVDRYVKLILELPHTLRNFAERHGERPGASYQVFTDRPVRLVFDGRGEMARQVWAHVVVDYVTPFTTILEQNDTGDVRDSERGEAWSVGGWIEYAAGERGAGQRAGGVNFQVESRLKRRRAVLWPEPLPSATPGKLQGPAGPGPSRLPVGVGGEFYKLTESDSLRSWRDDRAWVEPFVWLPLGGRWVLKSSVRFDYRELDYRPFEGRSSRIKNESVVAGAGAQVELGTTGRSVVEAGAAVEYRERRESCGCLKPDPERRDVYHDHRLYVSYEYRFSPARMIRLIETIDLDREDWGSFSIHDHGFVQAVFSF